jgi:hypothetical protein
LPSCPQGPWTAGNRRECGRVAVIHIFDRDKYTVIRRNN